METNKTLESIRQKVHNFPNQPGIYIMRGAQSVVLYVGKAKKLKQRVQSYFREKHDGRWFIDYLHKEIEDIDFIITQTEREALLLENTLIKKYQPKFNVLMRDDKSYLRVKLTLSEKYPRVLLTRNEKNKKDLYFGPFPEHMNIKKLYRFIKRNFPLRKCNAHVFRNRSRPCLYYEIKQCLGPCCNDVKPEIYDEIVRDIRYLLEGKIQTLKKRLKQKMWEKAQSLEFEQADHLKAILETLDTIREQQQVVQVKTFQNGTIDICNYACDNHLMQIQILQFIDGTLHHSRTFHFDNIYFDVEQNITSWLVQYYDSHPHPEKLILPNNLKECAEDINLYYDRTLAALPHFNSQKEALTMAEENAREQLKIQAINWQKYQSIQFELQEIFQQENEFELIECYDISHLAGGKTVGVRIVFRNGEPDKKLYRIYNIEDSDGNDLLALQEVFTRRLHPEKREYLPDLLIVDGGLTQLKTLLDVRNDYQLDFPVMAIAKERRSRQALDKLYLENKSESITSRVHPYFTYFIQKVRDETHRFAVQSMRRRYKKEAQNNPLREIPGIGQKKAQILLEQLGSLDAVKKATEKQLREIKGLNHKNREAILCWSKEKSQ